MENGRDENKKIKNGMAQAHQRARYETAHDGGDEEWEKQKENKKVK